MRTGDKSLVRSHVRRVLLLAGLVFAAVLAFAGGALAAPFVYVANSGTGPTSGSGTVSQFDGALSQLSPPMVMAGADPEGVAVSPNGKSAYVTNAGSGGGTTVSQYTINSTTGELSPMTPATVASAPGPFGIAVSPNGKFAYVTNFHNFRGKTVSQYTIDPTTGELSPMTPATVESAPGPLGIAVSPNGKNAYVTNAGSGTVSEYTIDASGKLTLQDTLKTPTSEPFGVAVSPGGRSAYVTDGFSDMVSQYTIDPTTGALSPM